MQVWLTFCGKKQSPYMYALHTYYFKDTFKTAMTLYLKGLCPDLLSVSPSYHSYRCLNIKIRMLAPHWKKKINKQKRKFEKKFGFINLKKPKTQT